MPYRLLLRDFDRRDPLLTNIVDHVQNAIPAFSSFGLSEWGTAAVLRKYGWHSVKGTYLIETYPPAVAEYLGHRCGGGDVLGECDGKRLGVEVSNHAWAGKCLQDIVKLSCADVTYRMVVWNAKWESTINRLETFRIPIAIQSVVVVTRDYVREATSTTNMQYQ